MNLLWSSQWVKNDNLAIIGQLHWWIFFKFFATYPYAGKYFLSIELKSANVDNLMFHDEFKSLLNIITDFLIFFVNFPVPQFCNFPNLFAELSIINLSMKSILFNFKSLHEIKCAV